jgi:hypothetical protein
MSRKGVGRGRRYTVRVNRDGSQQYARRGCLLLLVATLGGLWALAEGALAVWS